MKMTIELNVPKEITDEYDIVPEFRKVHKGESYISGSGVGVWTCLDKSSGLYIPLIKKKEPLNLKFPESLMSVPCAGIVMNQCGVWWACKSEPKETYCAEWMWNCFILRLDNTFFHDLPIVHSSYWRESWIPKPTPSYIPKPLCGGDSMKCPVSEGCAVCDGPCPTTSFCPSKLGDEYEVVCGWPDKSKMRPPKCNELCWDNESETVYICCIERKTPFIILRHKWKWPDGFLPGAVGVAWSGNRFMYAWFGTPKVCKTGNVEYWDNSIRNIHIHAELYPDLNLPNKDDWKNSYVPNPNHPANKKG